MRFGSAVRTLIGTALGCAMFLLCQLPAVAQDAPAAPAAPASTMMSDAQVEANVLKALAGAPQLADQSITTTTVYGEVTLSGIVRDEELRAMAETLASRAPGVKKVIGELTLGALPAAVAQQGADGTNPHLQSDGTMANGAPPAGQPDMAGAPPVPQDAPVARQAPPVFSSRRVYPRPPYGPGYPQAGFPQTAYPQQGYVPPYGAQQAGIAVVIPTGTMMRIRINQSLDSNQSQAGATFDGVVVNDVVADGTVAIPRGATVQGSVVETKPSGVLKGRGKISLQLTQVTLGGKVYPVVSDHWSSVGSDKTMRTVNNTVGLGAMGALIGAVAGGGPGAVIGAGVGGAAGLGTAAASGGGHALVPPEAILTFHLLQPARVATVSQAEMDRLGNGVPAGANQLRLMRRPQPEYYGPYGPGYYSGPYPTSYPYRD
jgi:hypothetical protein